MREATRRSLFQIGAFVITFLVYSSVHCCRATWSYSKSELKSDPGYQASDDFLGTVDFTFLMCYGVGLYSLGWLGDKMDLRIYLAIGLFATGIMFGSIAIMGINNYTNLAVFDVMMGLNGFSQSLAWPGCIATMGNWLPQKNRAIIMGLWSGSQNFGNIVGYEVGSIFIDKLQIGWQYAIITASAICLSLVIVILAFLRPYPEALGLVIREKSVIYSSILDKRLDSAVEIENEDITNRVSSQKSVTVVVENRISNRISEGSQKIHSLKSQDRSSRVSANNTPLGFFKAWTLPGVPFFALAYSCTKGTCYGLLFWLAPYLKENGQEQYSSLISQVNDIGQFIGGFVMGLLCERVGKKAMFLPIYLLMAAFFFVLIQFLTKSTAVYFVLIFFGGFFLGGPYNMIGSAIAADLAKNPILKGNKKGLSTVSALIQGSGSFAAAAFQKIVPYLKEKMFLFFFGICVLGALIMFPLAYADIKSLKSEREEQQRLLNREENIVDEIVIEDSGQKEANKN